MKKTVATILPVLLVLSVAAPVFGASVLAEARAGYFIPSSSDFRDVYKNGPAFGADVSVPVWGTLYAWGGVDYFGRTGSLTFTQEPTTLRIVPAFAGLRLQFGSSAVRPYLAAAAGLFFFKEASVLGAESGQKLGLVAQVGLLLRVHGRFYLDIHGRYTACRSTWGGMDTITSELGGYQGGIGVSVRI